MPHKLEVQFLKDVQQKIAEAETLFSQTGRTTRFVESLKDGQYVVSHSVEDSRRIEQLAKERGKDVYHLMRATTKGVPTREMRYTHTYVTDKLSRHIQEIQEWIEHLQHNEEKNYD